MPWTEQNVVSLRAEFVRLAEAGGVGVAELCRRYGISRKTGHKWIARHRELGNDGLRDRSRRPKTMRCPTPPQVEARVVALRREHPAWGGRKLHHVLKREGCDPLPAASTITAILHRHGLIAPEASAAAGPCQRFQREQPNELWQMDFKGEFRLIDESWCHPLTVLDDCTRFNLVLAACRSQKRETVRTQLERAFGRYGLPDAMLMDNGSPWATGHAAGRHTRLSAWLLRLGVRVLHGRPRHPQTQGKEERFHRTLKSEVLTWKRFADHAAAQSAFDAWRPVYNAERPHDALGMKTPSELYVASRRSLPLSLPPIEYGPGDLVRKVNPVGQLRLEGRTFKISEAFGGEPVALRATPVDGEYEVYYCSTRVAKISLREPAGGADEATSSSPPQADEAEDIRAVRM